ncbi:hypothetical protein [Saccharospirillum salsuginis]|uniref:Uncharacterized protein n=1 Tax=Saccharospirillum salsuginis TaxID=418750 RepID=A0A918K3T0_9GAMM|nr:hypothetical protein [Saccharospirillum salsuginis]GGX47767.1 hypothetical protein GCM10007392_13290 [Saccharospirillum salsuginis]
MTFENDDPKTIQKQLLKYQLFSTPAVVLIGLGLYGLFGAQGDAFLPILNDQGVVYSFLGGGIALEIWVLLKIIPLVRHRNRPSNPE